MKKTLTMSLISSIMIAAGVFSCNLNDKIPPVVESPDYSIIDGDTIKTKKIEKFKKGYEGYKGQFAVISWEDTVVTFKEPKLPPKPEKEPKLEKIKNEKDPELKSKPLKMIVIGGNLSSGVRDGGYFNEGILTSYPNLLARQMRLAKFENPLFDKEEYNGVGRQYPTYVNISGGPFQKFKQANNNLAYTDFQNGQFIDLKEYNGDLDNLAFPYSVTRSSTTVYIRKDVSKGQLISRLLKYEGNSTDASYMDLVKAKKYDFFVYEFGNDELFRLITDFGQPSGTTNKNDLIEREDLTEWELLYAPSEIRMMKEVLIPSGAKGVLLNIPDWLKAPYFVDSGLIREALIKEGDQYDLKSFIDNNVFMKTGAIDSILSDQVPYLLKPGIDPKHSLRGGIDYLSKDYSVGWIKNTRRIYTEMISRMAKYYELPIADIDGLVERSTYSFTDEFGSVVNLETFFSGDLIYPSPLGQALITNEIIRTMNSFYGLAIELINTSRI